MASTQKNNTTTGSWKLWDTTEEVLPMDDINFMEHKFSQDIYSIEDILKRVTPVFQENGVRSAILFGSYAKGCPTSSSDVDLVVDSDLKGLNLIGLIVEIQEALDKEVDVFRISEIIPDSKIELEMIRTGIKIYEK